MERKKIETILKKHNYSDDSIKKIFQCKMRPKLLKAIEIEELDNIPVHAWKDIKSFISNSNSNNKISNKTTIKAS